jgi:hypothetical protein
MILLSTCYSRSTFRVSVVPYLSLTQSNKGKAAAILRPCGRAGALQHKSIQERDQRSKLRATEAADDSTDSHKTAKTTINSTACCLKLLGGSIYEAQVKTWDETLFSQILPQIQQSRSKNGCRHRGTVATVPCPGARHSKRCSHRQSCQHPGNQLDEHLKKRGARYARQAACGVACSGAKCMQQPVARPSDCHRQSLMKCSR